jgi:hypothetical protein
MEEEKIVATTIYCSHSIVGPYFATVAYVVHRYQSEIHAIYIPSLSVSARLPFQSIHPL